MGVTQSMESYPTCMYARSTPEGKHSMAKPILLSSSNMRCPISISSLSNSPIFSLSVGSEAVRFYAHQKLLTESSVLERRCSDALRLFGTRKISLPEDDPEVIGHILDYLYGSSYITADQAEINLDKEVELLAKVFVAADKYDLYDLRVVTVKYLTEEDYLSFLSEESFLEISHYIYENTQEGDGEPVYKEFFINTACEWFQDESKHLADFVEPYVRDGGDFAYDIYRAQVKASRQKTIKYLTSGRKRKRSVDVEDRDSKRRRM